MDKRRILVTGGSGFLGAALVKRLASKGHFVRVFDNGFRTSTQQAFSSQENIQLVNGDIRNAEAVFQAIQGVDLVIHLAAINGTKFFYQEPDLVLDVGVKGILHVLDGCQMAGVDDLIVASSSEVYQTPESVPTDETEPLKIPDPLNPRYSYGGSKMITELLTLNMGRTRFRRALVFRPHNIYGPAMGREHVIPELIYKAIQAIQKSPKGPVPFTIQGDGSQTRAFIHIDDMIDGIEILIDRGEHLQIYHIGNPEEISIAHLAEKVMHFFDRESQLQCEASTLGSTDRRCPNIDKIKRLGFSPKISIDQGLAPVIEWYKNEDT